MQAAPSVAPPIHRLTCCGTSEPMMAGTMGKSLASDVSGSAYSSGWPSLATPTCAEEHVTHHLLKGLKSGWFALCGAILHRQQLIVARRAFIAAAHLSAEQRKELRQGEKQRQQQDNAAFRP